MSAFSVAGHRKGFEDARGTLFYEIARILKAKQPQWFILENVKGLLSHNGGKTLTTMFDILRSLGYGFDYKVLITADFEPPQKRERIFIVGKLGENELRRFNWPKPTVEEWGCVADIMHETHEEVVDEKYFLTDEQVASVVWKKCKKSKILEDGRKWAEGAILFPDPVDKPSRTIITGQGGLNRSTMLMQIGKLDVNYSQGARVYCPCGVGATVSSRGGGAGAYTGYIR